MQCGPVFKVAVVQIVKSGLISTVFSFRRPFWSVCSASAGLEDNCGYDGPPANLRFSHFSGEIVPDLAAGR